MIQSEQMEAPNVAGSIPRSRRLLALSGGFFVSAIAYSVLSALMSTVHVGEGLSIFLPLIPTAGLLALALYHLLYQDDVPLILVGPSEKLMASFRAAYVHALGRLPVATDRNLAEELEGLVTREEFERELLAWREQIEKQLAAKTRELEARERELDERARELDRAQVDHAGQSSVWHLSPWTLAPTTSTPFTTDSYLRFIDLMASRLGAWLPEVAPASALRRQGLRALSEAMEVYDADLCVSPELFTVSWVQSALLSKYVRTNLGDLYEPKKSSYENTYLAIQNAFGRVPSDAELAKTLHLPAERLGQDLTQAQWSVLPTVLDPATLSVLCRRPGFRAAALRSPHSSTLDLIELIESLPEDQRAGVVLMYYGGLSAQDASEVLGTSHLLMEQESLRATIHLLRTFELHGYRDASLDPLEDL